MAHPGSTLKPVVTAAADVVRQHNHSTVLPELLERSLHLPRWQAVATLKELADQGYGTFILGRRGGITRLEKADELPPALQTERSASASFSDTNSEPQQVLLLRRPRPVQVVVPADLTTVEAERISKWLRAIVVDSEG